MAPNDKKEEPVDEGGVNENNNIAFDDWLCDSVLYCL